MVREGGVEPPRPFGHTDLNRARLPIPPLARAVSLCQTAGQNSKPDPDEPVGDAALPRGTGARLTGRRSLRRRGRGPS